MAGLCWRRAVSAQQFRLLSAKPRWKQLIRLLNSESSRRTDENIKSKTHFGFQSVDEDEKTHKVYEVFENVATRYDFMNDLMSAGVHRLWKDMFLEQLGPSPGTKLLDVAGGTGDIAFRFLRYVNTPTHLTRRRDFKIPKNVTSNVYLGSPEEPSSSDEEGSKPTDGQSSEAATPPDCNGSHVTVCDINQAMLDVGREKSKQLGYTAGISWMKGDGEALPLPDNSFDAYTVAFGIRNCTHVQEVLNEAYRVLKPGGRFVCLEFSDVKNPLIRTVYDSYSFQVIPVMGHVITGDWKSYQYLVESIRQFPNQEDFAAMIKSAGFRMVKYRNLTFGIAAIHSGFKI